MNPTISNARWKSDSLNKFESQIIPNQTINAVLYLDSSKEVLSSYRVPRISFEYKECLQKMLLLLLYLNFENPWQLRNFLLLIDLDLIYFS